MERTRLRLAKLGRKTKIVSVVTDGRKTGIRMKRSRMVRKMGIRMERSRLRKK